MTADGPPGRRRGRAPRQPGARDLLRGLAAEGTTVLVSSHLLAEAAQAVDSVVILDRGRLVTQSALADLTASGRLEEVFLQLTTEPSAAN